MQALDLPVIPKSSRVRVVTTAKQVTNPYTGAVLTEERALGDYWMFTLDFGRLTPERTTRLTGFLGWLGSRNRVRLSNYARTVSLGVGGAPIIDNPGLVMMAHDITIKGWPPGQTVLRGGDFIEVPTYQDGIYSSELKMVGLDAVSDGGGAANVTISPSMRRMPDHGGAVVVDQAAGVFLLPTGQVEFSEDQFHWGDSITVDFWEDVLYL